MDRLTQRKMGYSSIEVPSDYTVRKQYPTGAVVAVVAGAFLTAFGATHALTSNAEAGSLYNAVNVAQPTLVTGLVSQRTIRMPASRVDAISELDEASYVQNSNNARSSAQQQGGLLASIGLLLGAVGAYCLHSKVQRSSWTMAAVSEVEDEMPSVDEMVAAKQEFLRLQGKGPGPSLAPGEILRPVNFPGRDGPVDLVEMYKQFEELLGDDIKVPVVGSRVVGTVFDLDDRGASIDFGGKTIGFCPLEELALVKVKHAEDVLSVGERRKFAIIAPATRSKNDDEELTLLSLKTIAEEVAWKRLQQYRENDVSFSVVLKGKNRGGYTVEVDDLAVPGFLPKSQATSDLATAPETADPSTFMNQVVEVKVLDLDQERRRLVVSQRAANPKMATDTFKVGTVHEGIVQNVKPYGVFVDVNGMSGLLHISQISHNRIETVDSIFKVGDKIKCMVLSQDQSQGRLALSTKRLEPTHGDMLTNPQLVYEKAEEMAARFREDIAAAEKRMQEFEAKLAEHNTVAFS